MIKLLQIVLLFLFLFGCASNTISTRAPSSATDEIAHYLAIDKFKYYINEYSLAMEGKIPDQGISTLRSLSLEEILTINLSDANLRLDDNFLELPNCFAQTFA